MSREEECFNLYKIGVRCSKGSVVSILDGSTKGVWYQRENYKILKGKSKKIVLQGEFSGG